MRPLSFRPSLSQIKNQAKRLRQDWQSGDAQSVERIRTHHPKYAQMSEGEIGDIVLSLRDAQLVVAREYNFENWAALKEQVEEEAAKPATLSVDIGSLLNFEPLLVSVLDVV